MVDVISASAFMRMYCCKSSVYTLPNLRQTNLGSMHAPAKKEHWPELAEQVRGRGTAANRERAPSPKLIAAFVFALK